MSKQYRKAYENGYKAGAERLISEFIKQYNKVHARTPNKEKKLRLILERTNNALEIEKEALTQ